MNLPILSTVLVYAATASMMATTVLSSYSMRERFPSARKWQTVATAVAGLTIYGSILVLWTSPNVLQKGWLVFPLWVAPVLLVLLVAQVVVAFRSPAPASRGSVFSRPPTSLLGLAVAAVSSVLIGYALGWMIGQMGTQFLKTDEFLTTILCIAGAVIAAAAMTPVLVIRLRAAAQHRRVIDSDQPMSYEVVDHAMKVAGRSALQSYSSSTTTIWILGGVLLIGVTMLIVPMIWRLIQTLPGGTGADGSEIKPVIPDFLSGAVGPILVVVLFAGMIFALVNVFCVPLYQEATRELAFAGLTDEQREEAVHRLFRTPIAHRFASKLRGAGRTIRVLTIRGDGTVITETLPGTELLKQESSPLYLEEGEDEPAAGDELENIDELELSDEERNIIDVMRRIHDRLDDPAHAHLGLKNFDVFERGREQLHIVAVGDDDYQDFPDEITQDIRDAL